MSDIVEYFDEGFTLSGNVELVVFTVYNSISDGSSNIFDFESDDEGFTLSGTGCLTYTFTDPMDTAASC